MEHFSLVNPYAAGIDVGDTEMVVAVSPGVRDQNVRTFGTFTCDYDQIVCWLKGMSGYPRSVGKYRCVLDTIVPVIAAGRL